MEFFNRLNYVIRSFFERILLFSQKKNSILRNTILKISCFLKSESRSVIRMLIKFQIFCLGVRFQRNMLDIPLNSME